jgi:hypothetical protein
MFEVKELLRAKARASGLTHAEVLMIERVSEYVAGQKGDWETGGLPYPSVARVAEEMSASTRTAQRVRARLRARGLLIDAARPGHGKESHTWDFRPAFDAMIKAEAKKKRSKGSYPVNIPVSVKPVVKPVTPNGWVLKLGDAPVKSEKPNVKLATLWKYHFEELAPGVDPCLEGKEYGLLGQLAKKYGEGVVASQIAILFRGWQKLKWKGDIHPTVSMLRQYHDRIAPLAAGFAKHEAAIQAFDTWQKAHPNTWTAPPEIEEPFVAAKAALSAMGL